MHILKKSTRLQLAVMMIKDCKVLIELHHTLTEQVLGKYVNRDVK